MPGRGRRARVGVGRGGRAARGARNGRGGRNRRGQQPVLGDEPNILEAAQLVEETPEQLREQIRVLQQLVGEQHENQAGNGNDPGR